MMSHVISAPALRGDDTLGFLAAVGVLSLSYLEEIPPLRLAWSEGLAGHAEFHSDSISTRETLVEALQDCLTRTASRNAVLPGGPSDLPLAKVGGGSDPNRLPPRDAANLHRRAVDAWLAGDPATTTWVAGLYGQTALATDKSGTRITPFFGASGQMSLRTSLYEDACRAVEGVRGPGDALTGWVRSTGYMGANLDARAIRNASVTTDGQPRNEGAPSPTWLASMVPALLPIAERDQEWGSLGWQRIKMKGTVGRLRAFVWPVWRQPVDGPALRALLSHPLLQLTAQEGRLTLARRNAASSLRGLGVTAVYASVRSSSRSSDGPLEKARRVWSE